jgi:hypothetical protein
MGPAGAHVSIKRLGGLRPEWHYAALAALSAVNCHDATRQLDVWDFQCQHFGSASRSLVQGHN